MLENLPFKLCTSGFNPKVRIYAKRSAHGLLFEGRTSTFYTQNKKVNFCTTEKRSSVALELRANFMVSLKVLQFLSLIIV